MNGITLTPEIEKLLGRYLQIQDETRRLDEEKARLKDRLAGHLAAFTQPFWFPVVAGQPLRIRVNRITDFTYNEELLRQRLGERYLQILKPDPAKIRRHLPALEELLRPALDLVGSPQRDQVRTAVERGAVPKDAFAGAFEKVSRTAIAVMRQRDDEAGPGTPRPQAGAGNPVGLEDPLIHACPGSVSGGGHARATGPYAPRSQRPGREVQPSRSVMPPK